MHPQVWQWGKEFLHTKKNELPHSNISKAASWPTFISLWLKFPQCLTSQGPTNVSVTVLTYFLSVAEGDSERPSPNPISLKKKKKKAILPSTELNMVLTERKQTLQRGTVTTTMARKREYKKGKKNEVGVHLTKKKEPGEPKTTQKHPAAIQLFNLRGGGERGQITASERIIFICDWLGQTEEHATERRREALQSSLKRLSPQSHDFVIYCLLKIKKPISTPYPGSNHGESKSCAHTISHKWSAI